MAAASMFNIPAPPTGNEFADMMPSSSSSSFSSAPVFIQSAPSGGSSFTLPQILCCLCGVSIESNPTNMCVNCIKSKIDITEGISKQVILFFCRGCGRYQRPPWVDVQLESKEMLALCLKKIKGLNKDVKLVDASFIWTEPHSRRIRVKLTVQKEVFNSAILQQSFEVEFVVTNQQCVDCQKSYTEHVWKAVVQVRQKVKHKRTIFYLEQLLLKHGVCDKVMFIKEMPGGLDFYWSSRSHALAMIDFLRSVVPIRVRTAKRLISSDLNSNIHNFKYTFYAELSPCSKDDCVLIDSKLQNQLGGVSPLLLVARVTSSLLLIDPVTLKLVELSGGTYWHNPFPPALLAKSLVEYIVYDIEKIENSAQEERLEANDMRAFNKQHIAMNNKLCLARAVVAKATDMGESDQQIECLTHLGNILKAGDSVLGYDIGNANLMDMDLKKSLKGKELPDVILVRKLYANKKNRSKNRKFTLRELPKEEGDKLKKKTEVAREQDEYEEFLQEIEEDPELRAKINLYKKSAIETTEKTTTNSSSSNAMDVMRGEGKDADEDADEVPEISMDELLDEMEALKMDERRAKAREIAMKEAENEGEDDGADSIDIVEGPLDDGEEGGFGGFDNQNVNSSSSSSAASAGGKGGKGGKGTVKGGKGKGKR